MAVSIDRPGGMDTAHGSRWRKPTITVRGGVNLAYGCGAGLERARACERALGRRAFESAPVRGVQALARRCIVSGIQRWMACHAARCSRQRLAARDSLVGAGGGESLRPCSPAGCTHPGRALDASCGHDALPPRCSSSSICRRFELGVPRRMGQGQQRTCVCTCTSLLGCTTVPVDGFLAMVLTTVFSEGCAMEGARLAGGRKRLRQASGQAP